MSTPEDSRKQPAERLPPVLRYLMQSTPPPPPPPPPSALNMLPSYSIMAGIDRNHVFEDGGDLRSMALRDLSPALTTDEMTSANRVAWLNYSAPLSREQQQNNPNPDTDDDMDSQAALVLMQMSSDYPTTPRARAEASLHSAIPPRAGRDLDIPTLLRDLDRFGVISASYKKELMELLYTPRDDRVRIRMRHEQRRLQRIHRQFNNNRIRKRRDRQAAATTAAASRPVPNSPSSLSSLSSPDRSLAARAREIQRDDLMLDGNEREEQAQEMRRGGAFNLRVLEESLEELLVPGAPAA
ncbi:hypothetical protein AYL99_11957 [Fonsecaea erecta]|uniref:Uncharacterized protein n=1 Tax=Fonsecaea erecta TaxID=1367422 RepID=A0A178Z2B0_9EURO|nr:hypothetical protein AYL99_11957 [Fonsecaea erecta]OAP53834.1 hypothetical protein AYL99_11957 [Fonsecaea erecta]